MHDVPGSASSNETGEITVSPGPDRQTTQDITLDLIRLEEIDGELAKRAITYAITGGGSAVLLELEQQSVRASVVLEHHLFSSTPREREITEAAIKARNNVLQRRHKAEAIWIRRYLEILAAPYKGPRRGVFGHIGPSPLWLRFHIKHWDEQGRPGTSDLPTVLNWRDPEENTALLALDLMVIAKTMPYYFRDHDLASQFDYASSLLAERAAVLESFPKYERPAQATVIGILKQFDLVNGEYFDFVYQQYLKSTSKAVRTAARDALLVAPPDTLRASAVTTLSDGNPAARAQAAQLLLLALKDQARPLLEAHLAQETARSVRHVIALGLEDTVIAGADATGTRTVAEDGAGGYLAADGSAVLTPDPAPLPVSSPLPQSVLDGYRKLLDQAYASNVKHFEHQKERYVEATAEQKKNWRSPPVPPQPVDYADAERYCATLVADYPISNEHQELHADTWVAFTPHDSRAATQAPFSEPTLTLWHLSRALTLDVLNAKHRSPDMAPRTILNGWSALAEAIHVRLTNGVDLRTLTALLPAILPPHALAVQALTSDISADLRADIVWPYLAGQFDVLDQALGQAALSYFSEPRVESALIRLKLFPKLPARYFNTVLVHALSATKALNKLARALLLDVEGIEHRLVPFLADGKQDVRAGVAQMLGTLGVQSTIEPMKQALAKEKSDIVRAALLRALRRLGTDISDYVTPNTLVKEAAVGLKTKKAKDIAWLPLDSLPALTWINGGIVPADVPKWWIALAGKLAQPGGNDLFSLWLDQLTPMSADVLGSHILGAFLRYDAVHCSEEEANAYAQANAQTRYEQYQEYARHYDIDNFYSSYTYEKVFAELRAARLATYLNNAYADRGILGLATRVEGSRAVQQVGAYMRDNYTRTAQVKALTEYLSGNPAPACLQMLLSIARRHRTNTVQELAGQLVDRISDERGWTTDELADRTIPTAGLDERGVLAIEIGSRTYQAKLDAEDALVLYNPDGKIVQSLPQAKEGPDKDSAAVARKALTNARKEIRQVHDFQTKRLYEALCVGRCWPVADWYHFLLEHPIVGRLVQRVIWLALDEQERVLASFRVLEDLSLTDNIDRAVDSSRFASIRLAHRSLLNDEDARAWMTHLTDYKVTPLFNQLDRPLLASDTGAAIEDRTGYILEAFKLRSAAQKLGYERAQAEDGGWFTQYLKPFASIGVTAMVEFTGSRLPEENRPVALLAVKFVRSSAGRRSVYGREMPLKDVPPVLLSEVWNDVHQIADAGIGFASDWREKVNW